MNQPSVKQPSVNEGRRRTVPTVVLALVVPVVVVATVVITLSATSTPSTSSAAPARPAGTAVEIKDFAFAPTPLVAKAGSAITVTNGDGTAHTLTADDKSFDTGNLDGGAHATLTLGGPGTYTYHCEIHNYMTGKIEVR